MKMSTKIIQAHGMITIMDGDGAVGSDRSQPADIRPRQTATSAPRWGRGPVSPSIQTREGQSNV
jgi:hypothetical protein